MSYLGTIVKAGLVGANLFALYINPMNFSISVRIGRMLRMCNIGMNTLYYYEQSWLIPTRQIDEDAPKPEINARNNLYVITDIVVQTIINVCITMPYVKERLNVLAAAAMLTKSNQYLDFHTRLNISNAYHRNFFIPIFISLLASYCVYYAFAVYDNKCNVKQQDAADTNSAELRQKLVVRGPLHYNMVPLISIVCSFFNTLISTILLSDYYCAKELEFTFGLQQVYEVTTPVFDAILGILITLGADVCVTPPVVLYRQ